jgi:hypothetical protein
MTNLGTLIDSNNDVLVSNNKALVFVLPNDYTRVNYIASTGTQHIDTRVIPTSDNLVFEWEGRDINSTNSTSIFGSEWAIDGNYSNRVFGGVLHGNNTRRNLYVGKTTGLDVGYRSSSDTDFHKWSLIVNSDHTTYLIKDSIKLTTYSWTNSFNKYNSIALFCNHTSNSFSQKASVAYKYFRMRDEGGWLFWGIPAKRKSDSVLGMYDLITKQFFTNAGTGTFIEG